MEAASKKRKYNTERRERLAEEAALRGEEMKFSVQPKNIIKVTGTRDAGFREVVQCNDTFVMCLQLRPLRSDERRTPGPKFVYTGYSTRHQWDKVLEILHTEMPVNIPQPREFEW